MFTVSDSNVKQRLIVGLISNSGQEHIIWLHVLERTLLIRLLQPFLFTREYLATYLLQIKVSTQVLVLQLLQSCL